MGLGGKSLVERQTSRENFEVYKPQVLYPLQGTRPRVSA
jgi:hypothetical protein